MLHFQFYYLNYDTISGNYNEKVLLEQSTIMQEALQELKANILWDLSSVKG